jgi:hypothetical protein
MTQTLVNLRSQRAKMSKVHFERPLHMGVWILIEKVRSRQFQSIGLWLVQWCGEEGWERRDR